MKPVSLILLAAAALFAQQEKPVALYPGMGAWRHPIATRSPEAQKYFDQGLALTYGFNRYEGLRSFRKAAELDPEAAMSYWGIAMALGPYINMDGDPSFEIKQSCAAVNHGLALKNIEERERPWLEAAATRCPDFADSARYIAAMRSLAGKFPDDPDAQTLYADSVMIASRWRWYSSDGKPAEGMVDAERALESVLRRYPNHPGANHLYIHAVESSPTPERAIPSAQRLMGIMPGAGHMVHMPGHIWLRVGDFDNAVAVNERAADVDQKYFSQSGVSGSYYMYYLHNLQFILHARGMQGRAAEAKKAERRIAEASAPMVHAMPEMAGLFDAAITMSQLHLYRWDEVIAKEKPNSESPLSLTVWRYSRAFALAAKGRREDARKDQSEFEKLRKTLDQSAPWGMNKTGDVMELASTVLEARMQSSPGDAIPLWKKAVTLQDSLGYDEPPAWYHPIRESLGAALLLSGNAADAEDVFREGLQRSPNNGRMLFGLVQSLKAQQKTGAAAWVEHEYEGAWKGADIQLRMADL